MIAFACATFAHNEAQPFANSGSLPFKENVLKAATSGDPEYMFPDPTSNAQKNLLHS